MGLVSVFPRAPCADSPTWEPTMSPTMRCLQIIVKQSGKCANNAYDGVFELQDDELYRPSGRVLSESVNTESAWNSLKSALNQPDSGGNYVFRGVSC